MQGLALDWLTSKRIPTTGKLDSLQRLVAQFTKAANGGLSAHATIASSPSVKPAILTGISTHTAAAVPVEQTRIYTGSMTISGTLSATSGQSGTWSGTLTDSLSITVDRNGTGTGYETFSGNISVTVTNPDGSHKTAGSSLSFYTPVFSVTNGKFTHTESSGLNFSGLILTVNLSGSFGGATQGTISEQLSMPFSGFVNGVAVSGSVNGSGTVTATAPLTIVGAAARQTAYAGKGMNPFGGMTVVDLNRSAVKVTATVTISSPAHGTLTNLAGGSYNRATGVYTITGTEGTVNQALRGLVFDPTAALSAPTATGFVVNVKDTKGASQTNRTTTVIATTPLRITGTAARLPTTGTNAVSPFRQVAITDLSGSKADEIIKVTMSNAGNGIFKNLGGGLYNKAAGVYLIRATPAAAMAALRGLIFVPAKSSGSAVNTSFTITVKNAAGASVSNSNTTVIDSPAKLGNASDVRAALFRQYLAPGFDGISSHALTMPTGQSSALASHFELAASHR